MLSESVLNYNADLEKEASSIRHACGLCMFGGA